MARLKIELEFSDVTMGCDEFGHILRPQCNVNPAGGGGRDFAEEEDAAYKRHVSEIWAHRNPRVRDGFLFIDELGGQFAQMLSYSYRWSHPPVDWQFTGRDCNPWGVSGDRSL